MVEQQLTRRQKGQAAEQFVLRCLLNKGYRLITTNYATEEGEIDLILFDRQTIVFLEVRSRQSEAFLSGEETITFAKQSRIAAAARTFRYVYHLKELPYRFDIAIVAPDESGRTQLRHTPNAFSPRSER